MKESLYITTGLANLAPGAYQVYALLRLLDRAGSGVLRGVKIQTLAAYLLRSPTTIKRRLKKGEALGFYYFLTIVNGVVSCSYKSHKRIMELHPEAREGLAGEVPTQYVLKDINLASTWLEAGLRTYRHYRKLRRLPKRKGTDPMFGKRVVTYEDLVVTKLCEGHRLNRNGTITIEYPSIIHAGASQQTISDNLGRHRITINRRLKKAVKLFDVQPHKRVYRFVPLESLPHLTIQYLLEYKRYGRYTLGRNGMVWENSTCVYPLDLWTPAPKQEEAVPLYENTGELTLEEMQQIVADIPEELLRGHRGPQLALCEPEVDVPEGVPLPVPINSLPELSQEPEVEPDDGLSEGERILRDWF